MKKFITLILVILMVLSTTGCKPKETTLKETTKVVLMLDWTPNTNHTGIYVALDKSYFKQRNLDVEIIQPSEVWPEQAVSAGKADFGISFQEALTQYVINEGAPLVAISAILQHDTSGFIWLKDSGINSPKDFENKTYGGWGTEWENALVKYIMKDNGANPDNLKMVQLGVFDQITGLVNKLYDFTWIYYAWEGIDAEVRNVDFTFYRIAEQYPKFDHYTPIFITNKKMIEEKPDVVKAFTEAVSEGYTFAANNPDEAASILLKYAPELNKELVEKSQKWISKEYISDASCFGIMKEETWKSFTDFMYEAGLLKTKLEDVSELFTNYFIPCEK